MSNLYTVASATLLASFCCSLFEAVLYSITPSQLELLKQRGVKGADRMTALKADVEEPIAAILTINTIAHTVGSAWCGSMVAAESGSKAVGVFAAVFTFLVLVLTEIIPKSLGVRYARGLVPFVSMPISIMVWLAYPIARPAKAAMGWITGPEENPGPSEDEVLLFSGLAAKHGKVRLDEHTWVQNALRLDRVHARDLRTPRTVVNTLPAESTVGEAQNASSQWAHSRIPLVEAGNADRVVGLVYRREVMDAALNGKSELELRELMHPLRFVPETTPAHELLDLFINERKHMVAVADEYGGFDGVVTLEDVLECLLGEEIVDEHDSVDDMQAMARSKNRLAQQDTPKSETESQAKDPES